MRRPLASTPQQLSLLSRTATALQVQLASVQSQLRDLADSAASAGFMKSAASSAAADPLLSLNYQQLAAAIPANKRAAAVAAIAASRASHTFRPAVTQVKMMGY